MWDLSRGLNRDFSKGARVGVQLKSRIVLLMAIAALLTIALSGCQTGANDANSVSGTTNATQTEGENSGGFVAEASSTVTVDIQE